MLAVKNMNIIEKTEFSSLKVDGVDLITKHECKANTNEVIRKTYFLHEGRENSIKYIYDIYEL